MFPSVHTPIDALRAPAFPRIFLAFLGLVFLAAPGDASRTGNRLGVSVGLLAAAALWTGLAHVLGDRSIAAPTVADAVPAELEGLRRAA